MSDHDSSKLAAARVRPISRPAPSKDGAAKDTRKGVQSVDLAFAILAVMEAAERALAVKEIAGRMAMPASKVHHYLVSLVRCGVLRQTPDGAYDLGPFALQLGLSSLRRLDPIERSNQAAQSLRDATGEATFIAVWGSHGPTIVRYFEGFQPVTVEVRAGLVLPVATSATGRVFLAWGGEALVDPIVAREPGVAADTIEAMRIETRAMGLGRVDGDLLPRIASLSAPVFDRDGHLALAITALGWSGDFDTDPEGAVAGPLVQATAQLSRDLGFSRS